VANLAGAGYAGNAGKAFIDSGGTVTFILSPGARMAYVSFTRKYRPQTFQEVVGQPHVSQTLRHAVAHDQVAHAYLFCGPRGTGKTTLARILAKALNCRSGPRPEPCGECDLCLAIRDGRALDVVEVDAASNRGIDEIRELRERVKYSPAESRCKVYILDEVHMLTNEAFNALLKTLEEPPGHTYFVLATTEPHKVPATILSRCQRFDFRRIGVPDIAAMLQRIASVEGVAAEPEALSAMARAADGAMRDGESILEQMVAYAEGPITAEIVNGVLGLTESALLAEAVDIVVRGDVEAACRLVDRVVAEGKDLGQLVADLTLYLRDLLRLALGATAAGAAAEAAGATAQARALGPARLVASIRRLGEAQAELRKSFQHELLLEMALLELCAPPAEAGAAAPTVREAPAAQAAPPPQPPPPATRPVAEPIPAPVPPTPVATPVAAPAAAPVSAGDLAAGAEGWERVKAALKAAREVSLAALLQPAHVSGVSDAALTISFPVDHRFHQSRVLKSVGQVEAVLAQVFGRPLRLEAVLSDETRPAPRPAVASVQEPDPLAEPAEPDPLAEPEPAAASAPEQAPSEQPDLLEQVLDVFPGSTVRETGSGSQSASAGGPQPSG